MLGDWLATFEALKAVYADEAYSNIAINEAVEHHKECSGGFVRAFAKGVIRDTMRLDYCVEKLADKGLKGIKKRTLIVLRMGIYAIDSLDSVPDYAAVNEAVALAKKVSRGTDRFINALLRRYLKEKDNLATDESNLSLRYSFPQKLVDLLQSQYGEDTEKLLIALNTAPDLILRTNTLMAEPDELAELLAKDGIICKPVEGSRTALVCKKGQPVSTSYYRDGWFSVQSLSSIKSIEAFAPKQGSHVLDMCAAPGGKSCAMAELMCGEGSITACDIHPHRLELIDAYSDRLGLDIIEAKLQNGTEFREEWAGAFDFVLADVPCSGIGVIGSKPELKLRTNPDDYAELTGIQAEILENAYKYLKPGGRLMYSTCTINRYENEGIVDSFCEKHGFPLIIEKHAILPYNNSLIGFFYCIIEKSV